MSFTCYKEVCGFQMMSGVSEVFISGIFLKFYVTIAQQYQFIHAHVPNIRSYACINLMLQVLIIWHC